MPEPISEGLLVEAERDPPSMVREHITESPVAGLPVVASYIGKVNPDRAVFRFTVSWPVVIATGLVTVAMVPPTTVAVTGPVTAFTSTRGTRALEVTAVPNHSTTLTLVEREGTVAVIVPVIPFTSTRG